MAVAMEQGVVYAHLYRALALASVSMLAFVFGGAILALFLTRHFRGALASLVAATKAGAAGDLEARAPLVGPREVAHLASQFNEMQQARQSAEARIVEHSEALAAANQELRTFLAMLTHELRTPLSVIDGAVQSLEHLHQPEDEAIGLRYRRIRRSVRRINGLVKQFLTKDKIDHTALSLRPVQLNATEQIRIAIESSVEGASERVRLAAPLHLQFQGDPALVQLALINLIDNALKYSPQEALVAVDIETLECDGKPGVVWTISDRGDGIEAASREEVFGKYARGKDHGHIGGAGLGLYLVRRIAQLHGGSVEIVERAGWGAVFRFWLPEGSSTT
jgi:signal transduction histidine kinase